MWRAGTAMCLLCCRNNIVAGVGGERIGVVGNGIWEVDGEDDRGTYQISFSVWWGIKGEFSTGRWYGPVGIVLAAKKNGLRKRLGMGSQSRQEDQFYCRKPDVQCWRPQQGNGSGTRYRLEAEEKGNGRILRGTLPWFSNTYPLLAHCLKFSRL